MSTRCLIAIGTHKAMIYRHHDGYPGGIFGVCATLLPFLRLFRDKRGWDQEYMLAQLAANQISEIYRDSVNDFTGIGIVTDIPGDLSFVYLVRKDWKVEVRRHQAGVNIDHMPLLEIVEA